jgi:uncharacterized membrane protein YfcA
MEFGFPYFCAVGVALVSASVLQSVTGFGFALFAIPIMIWLGMTLPQAIAVSLGSLAIQTLHATIHLRKEVKWRSVVSSSGVRLIALPLGMFVLFHMKVLSKDQIKQVVGAVVLVAVLAQWLWHVEPRERLHPIWGLLAFFGSGFTAGLCGMGGPPLVLWVMARKWNGLETRGFLMANFGILVPVNMALLYYAFRDPIPKFILIGLAFSPLILAGNALGLRIGDRLPKARLRQLAFGLLVVVGASSIAAPYV